MAPHRRAGQDQRMVIHLLIVDDSKLIRASLHGLLERSVRIASIREAATLGQALDSARRNLPTLVILDQNLPDGLGMNIFQQLKQLSPRLRIAMLTMSTQPDLRQRCLALGADWFFDKFTETESLLDVVMQLASPDLNKAL